MSRSLLFSFLIALIIHSLFSQVQLGFLKRPVSWKKNLSKTLTIDIIKPRQVSNPALTREVEKNTIEMKKVGLKPEIKQTTKKEKNIKTRKQTTENKTTEEDQVLAHTLHRNLPVTKKEDIDLEKNNIPAQKELNAPTYKDISEKPKQKGSLDPPAFTHISYTLPIYLENPAPEYPKFAERRGYQGTVILDVLVNKDGKTGSIQLSKSSGYEILDRAAIRGVREWLFHPAKRGDELVDAWVKIPIKFRLE